MKAHRLLWTSSALCMMLAACEKQKSTKAATGGEGPAGDLSAERAALEDERATLERERLEEERAALEEEKEALRAERESRLAAREQDADDFNASLEDRQREIDRREANLADREGDLAARESDLDQQEYVSAGYEPLDDWEPEPIEETQEPVADYETFYEDLQPYGSWYETPEYGYVYQPTVVAQDASWRPYTRGRWACTNLGWNWCSDEPFGWACFHYGRWCLIEGRGWAWVPGDEWAPSWVCWREGGDHVGWAPLPPETLCYRNRGWNKSVEADFGISWSMFTFVHCRHMADPLWKHCLPVADNRIYVPKTTNVTNIQYHRNQIVSGGPRWEKLQRFVGKPWPVYQLQIDRLKAFNQKAQERNAVFRGKQLAVFAPNFNTKWNANLKPPRLQGKWDNVKVERAEAGIKPEWRERFRDARQKQQEQAAVWVRDGGDRQKQLKANRQKVSVAQEKLEVKQQKIVENRREKFAKIREQERESQRPDAPANPAGTPQAGDAPKEGGRLSLAERQRQNAQRLREQRAQRNGGVDPSPKITAREDEEPQRPAAEPPAKEDLPRGGAADRLRERRQPGREPQPNNNEAATPQPPGNNNPVAPQPEQNGEGPRINRRERQQEARNERQQQQEQAGQQQAQVQEQEISRRERMEEARRQQVEQAAEREQQQQAREGLEENRRQRMEQARQQQQERARQQQEEQAGQQAEENNRRQRMEEARRQQQETARERTEQNQRQQEMRERQEQARQQNEENNRRQQQEERAQQQERMRQQQEERALEQAERARQQEEARRQAQERERQQQEERARQQEQMRQQQEESRRQQEEARRQQQEERARQQEEERRQQQEERARQQEEARRQAEERARQQEESRRQQEEARRQQQEENARQQQERSRQEQERSRQQDDERQRRGR
ncbi:DUF6600 domain-containing protein [Luteolibacter luteus]|uniref:Uncharacterized protein n=1 Tax=Luteolibacter luteus TaxID=2728835 RepID=A0A858REH1_9BACT|nr:DUF6600 domain-containing protein [Luteolibacter luteus]QJE94809.1 hypothetical protein HHL09_03120 [Luteolibacter luteus]